MTAPAAAGRSRLASPATWLRLLGGLAVLSLAAMIPLTFLTGQVFNGVVHTALEPVHMWLWIREGQP